jgi:hypothetical protein
MELRLRSGLDSGQPNEGLVLYIYNSSATDGQLRVVDTNQPSLPSRSDLSDASLGPGQSFADTAHQFFLTVVSATPGYYAVSISSEFRYSLSIVAPSETNVLQNRSAHVLVDPPVPGYGLAVSLDNSSAILNGLTNITGQYNFTLFFATRQAGTHTIDAILRNPKGEVVATSSYAIKVSIPPWISLLQPEMIWIYVAIGVAALIGVSFFSSFRESSKGQDTAQP